MPQRYASFRIFIVVGTRGSFLLIEVMNSREGEHPCSDPGLQGQVSVEKIPHFYGFREDVDVVRTDIVLVDVLHA